MQYVIKFDSMKESEIIYAPSLQYIVDIFNNEIQRNTRKKIQMLKKINKNIDTDILIKEEYDEFLYLDAYITKYYELCNDARRQILI